MIQSKLTPLYVFPSGMGDAVMALAVARNYYSQTGNIMHVGHKCTEIFTGCKYIKCHPEYAFWALNGQSEHKAETEGYRLISLFYFAYRQVVSGYWIHYPLDKNLVSLFCSQAGLYGKIELHPVLELTEEEKKIGEFAKGKIVVISTGVATYKSWSVGKVQKVIDSFPEYGFIQIGMPSDPPLNHVEDCRGKFSLRQIAGILYHSRLFFGPVGGIMHLARSVNCPALILMPSFESESWYYSGFHYLKSTPRCTKCDDLKRNHSQCTHRESCINISVEAAIREIQNILTPERECLPPETVEITPKPVNGLDLYQKMISCFPYEIKVICSSSRTQNIDVFEFYPDEGASDITISIDPDKYHNITVTINQNLKWLFEISEIWWEDPAISEKNILRYRTSRFLKYHKDSCLYLSSYSNDGKIKIDLPDSIASVGILHLNFNYKSLENVIPPKTKFLSRGWQFRCKAHLLYYIIRLWNAVWSDSLLNVTKRSLNVLLRLFK